jgi:integrase
MIEQLLINKPPTQMYLFGKSSDPKVIYVKYSYALRNVLRQIGLYKKLENGVNQITVHSFRSFFRTLAGHSISRDFAEAYIGHRFYQSEYQNMHEIEKKKIFLELEPHITFNKVQIMTRVSNSEISGLQ